MMHWKLLEGNSTNCNELPKFVVIIDLDFFIRYCKRFDKKAVEKIINEINQFFLKNKTKDAFVYQSDGDEYMFEFYENCNLKKIQDYIQLLKNNFRKQHFLMNVDYNYRFARLSFSAGISVCKKEEGGIKFARQKALVALNQAKALRRNCVVCFPEKTVRNNNIVYFNKKLELSILFGKSGIKGFCNDKKTLEAALLDEPQSIAADSRGNIYIADQNNHSIVKFDGIHVYSIVGNGKFSNHLTKDSVNKACLNKPTGITVKGTLLYITDTGNDVVWKVDMNSMRMTVLAGNGVPGFEGDGIPAIEAKLNKPGGIVIDKEDNIYINDIANNLIRKVGLDGVITTYAGTGQYGYAGDGTDACNATFGEIYGMGIDREAGEIFLADYHNHCIRMIDIQTHMICTVAGCGIQGYEGDGDDALKAKLTRPVAVCVDRKKNIIIAESGNHCIRILERKSNKIYTLAGDGSWGIGSVKQAYTFRFANPNAVCLGADNKLYVVDEANNRICLLNYEGEK
ncbi:GGDEF domain-containing protein [Lachnotalea glycerini]|uniref:GGDEF domain-containing protein n=1 Tax=Lachnotalea glycerini TaxID=1763509 RepID=A0A318ESU7_9FIRM|nr:diguanylate cyclase [Lachnotalea glycerini]PXV95590.1 GGDEF domain-containing protein [Lachnotalea glycerini]